MFNFVFQHWVDEFLSWNPAKFGNMTRIIVPPTHIWLPDFGLENRCDIGGTISHQHNYTS